MYCKPEDLYLIFGKENVRTWADLDNNNNASDIESRIELACDIASKEVDSILGAAPFSVPLMGLGATHPLIRYAAASIAGVFLYESRGATTVDSQSGEPYHPYVFKRIWAYTVLREIASGRRKVEVV